MSKTNKNKKPVSNPISNMENSYANRVENTAANPKKSDKSEKNPPAPTDCR